MLIKTVRTGVFAFAIFVIAPSAFAAQVQFGGRIFAEGVSPDAASQKVVASLSGPYTFDETVVVGTEPMFPNEFDFNKASVFATSNLTDIGGAFDQEVSGSGQHASRAVTSVSQTLVNNEADRRALVMDITVRGGRLEITDTALVDPNPNLSIFTDTTAYFGLSVTAGGALRTVGTLNLISDHIGGFSHIADGALAQLTNLAFTQTDTGMFFTWEQTVLHVGLGEMDPMQSLDLQYKVVTATGSSGFDCKSEYCPGAALTFDPLHNPSVDIAFRSAQIPVADPLDQFLSLFANLFPPPAPAAIVFPIAPPPPAQPEIPAEPLLLAQDVIPLFQRAPVVGVPAPEAIGLLALAGLLGRRRTVRRLK